MQTLEEIVAVIELEASTSPSFPIFTFREAQVVHGLLLKVAQATQIEERQYAVIGKGYGDSIPAIMGYYQHLSDAKLIAEHWNKVNAGIAKYTVEPGEDW